MKRYILVYIKKETIVARCKTKIHHYSKSYLYWYWKLFL